MNYLQIGQDLNILKVSKFTIQDERNTVKHFHSSYHGNLIFSHFPQKSDNFTQTKIMNTPLHIFEEREREKTLNTKHQHIQNCLRRQ